MAFRPPDIFIRQLRDFCFVFEDDLRSTWKNASNFAVVLNQGKKYVQRVILDPIPNRFDQQLVRASFDRFLSNLFYEIQQTNRERSKNSPEPEEPDDSNIVRF